MTLITTTSRDHSNDGMIEDDRSRRQVSGAGSDSVERERLELA
jgi:hypothetical protein